jgi:toxin ParE1/3/4
VAEVIWSDGALANVGEIAAYIARDSPRQARLFTQRVFQSTQRLTVFPRSGRAVAGVGRETVREVIFQSYRIVYEIDGDDVRILAVRHAARQSP